MQSMKKLSIFLLLAITPYFMAAQAISHTRTIQWRGIQTVDDGNGGELRMLRFSGSVNDPARDYAPLYHEVFSLPPGTTGIQAELRSVIFETAPADEQEYLRSLDLATQEIRLEQSIGHDRKQPFATVTLLPVRLNTVTGMYEKLTRFVLDIDTQSNGAGGLFKSAGQKKNSVLASGGWYKIAVTETGIYRLTYDDLSTMGIPVASIDPRDIRIYGLDGGMLPENTQQFRYDGLQEAAIYVEGEGDGAFNPGDYVLFYGRSPHTWEYSQNYHLLEKQLHLYDDYTYYFITTDMGAGKRIETVPSSGEPPTNHITTFHDASHYEVEEVNLLHSGRIWYGELFDLFNNLVKEFTIPNHTPGSQVILRAEAAARSQSTSFFTFSVNNSNVLQLAIPGTNLSNVNGDFAKSRTDTARFHTNGANLSVKVTYTKPASSSVGWLNYFTLNYQRNLVFNGGQLAFRHLSTASMEVVSKYTLTKANNQVKIWHVTDPLTPEEVETTLSGTELAFAMKSDRLQQFIAFDGQSFRQATFVGQVENQNLRGIDDHDMVILTHPLFRDQAERLAQFHRDHDNMTVFVTEPEQVYHEFSAGSQDITAIRDFMKYLYDHAEPGKELKYLLLFGDGSFDYKDREENNTNFIPTWESYESLHPVNSYVKDDFYGLLDDGGDTFVDIGIGRFVVRTSEEARSIVDKTILYATNSEMVMGDWRNLVCLIADDEDSNLHFGDAEDLASIVDTTNKALNIDKIYLDAYQQVSTPSGERYPDVTLDINNRVDRGALIMNYVGHGGEGGLAHERIMTINDINSWDNMENMPVFITATCEFSRFDDPARTSAGEYISLNPNGGGIALFTTTRATYAGANFDLNRNFYRYALKRVGGQYLRMGDIIRLAKNASGSVENKSKFMLIGDPALRIAFPTQGVITTKINGISVDEAIDTLRALSKVTISGEITDTTGNKLTDFNGILYPTVFDKPSRVTTLGNDPGSSPQEFQIQKNALYKGKITIQNGDWEFTFIAPKDIAYQYGFGKLSYYARNDHIDANGYFNEVVVGGYNESAEADNEGPQVSLYMNDLSFRRGGLTDENPDLLATIFDENGINTVGNGIGHDIIATLDGQETYVLNNYYEAALDNYQEGSIRYPFYNLANGRHTLSLKVWDIYNNSTTATTEFIVAESVEMALNDLINYPNPFRETTTFSFEHNQVEQPLDITIHIYSLSGQHVATLGDIYHAGGYRYKSIAWNGTDSRGNKLQEGMYIYKVLVRNYDGSVVDMTNKLVIMR